MLVTSIFSFSHSVFHLSQKEFQFISYYFFVICSCFQFVGWFVVLRFKAILTGKVISWRSVMHMCFLAFSHQYLHNFSFQSHWLLFPHASAEVRGENTPERKVASTGDQTHNHQVMSLTCSPLSHPGGGAFNLDQSQILSFGKELTLTISWVWLKLPFNSLPHNPHF